MVAVQGDSAFGFAGMEMETAVQPAVITKDLTCILYARDSKISAASRTMRSLFGGVSKGAENNRVPGVYELVMKEAQDTGSPGIAVARSLSPLSPFLRPLSPPLFDFRTHVSGSSNAACADTGTM